MFTECGNGLQYLEPSTKWKTQLTEMIFREVGKDVLVYLVLAEYRLILFEAQAPQPDHNIHDGAQTQGCHTSSCGTQRVSRTLARGPKLTVLRLGSLAKFSRDDVTSPAAKRCRLVSK